MSSYGNYVIQLAFVLATDQLYYLNSRKGLINIRVCTWNTKSQLDCAQFEWDLNCCKKIDPISSAGPMLEAIWWYIRVSEWKKKGWICFLKFTFLFFFPTITFDVFAINCRLHDRVAFNSSALKGVCAALTNWIKEQHYCFPRALSLFPLPLTYATTQDLLAILLAASYICSSSVLPLFVFYWKFLLI